MANELTRRVMASLSTGHLVPRDKPAGRPESSVGRLSQKEQDTLRSLIGSSAPRASYPTSQQRAQTPTASSAFRPELRKGKAISLEDLAASKGGDRS